MVTWTEIFNFCLANTAVLLQQWSIPCWWFNVRTLYILYCEGNFKEGCQAKEPTCLCIENVHVLGGELIYSRAKVILENPLSIAFTVGTCFPNVGKQLAWKRCCFGAMERKAVKTSQQTTSSLNACGLVLFFPHLFILCYTDSLYIFYFPNDLHHLHPSIHSIYMCAAQSVVIARLAKEFWRVWGWMGLKTIWMSK